MVSGHCIGFVVWVFVLLFFFVLRSNLVLYSFCLLRVVLIFLLVSFSLFSVSYADGELKSWRDTTLTGAQNAADSVSALLTVTRGTLAVGDPDVFIGISFNGAIASEYRKARVVLVGGVETFQVRTHPANVVVSATFGANSPSISSLADGSSMVIEGVVRSGSINGATIKTVLVATYSIKRIVGNGSGLRQTYSESGSISGVGSGSEECPPRDLKFIMSLGIDASPIESHSVNVTLTINESSYEVVSPIIIKGPLGMELEHDVPNVPGAFTYSWKHNGAVIATGMYGCGDEIPLNRVTDMASVVADPLNDQDGDGDPDVTDPDIDGDGIPNAQEPTVELPGAPPSTPPPGTNAGPGAPDGSVGTPILEPGKSNPLPSGLGAGSGNTLGDVNVLNIGDFAKAFKWGMEEAGNGNGFFASPGNGVMPSDGLSGAGGDGDALSTAPIDDLVEAVGTMRMAKEDAAALAEAMATTMVSHKPMGPSPVVSVSTWRVQMGSDNGKLFGRDYFDLNLSPYADAIEIFRLVASWVLLVIAWFKFWNYFRSIVAI